ncbi:MAG: capsular polysaccharide biosynthesis protein CapF [Bacteroidales bacterium]|nr:capsular polysaccharide biosynthesis protein CapF [Bacteroidales bacterium]
MKILVTGAKGFVGKNLVAQLQNIKQEKARWYSVSKDIDIYEYDIDSTEEELDKYCRDCDFVFHLAGVNRPKEQKEFMEGNFGFTDTLLNTLKKHKNTCPVMISSSIQALLDNPYGESKRAGENLMREYSKQTGAKVLIYRFPNVFGKWCKPNYNSAVATFCNNIANDLPIQVNDPNVLMHLVYIDDVVDELISALSGNENREGDFCKVKVEHEIKLGEIVDLIKMFRSQSETLIVPEMAEGSFEKKLYATYLSYLPKDKVKFPLKMNTDARGSFTELLKTNKCGQFSVNVSNPGITKGEHWHNTKWEFFIVVSGHALIEERKIGSEEVISFEVSGDKPEAVHMLPGYTHNITNLSKTEKLITLMWANELFDPQRPDTYFEKVNM